MALVINTNVSSLTAQSNLNKTQSMLSKATEALSSGLKINSAADDAAGYAISQRFTTQIGGLNQANSNASDAISLAQTAESALSQITSNLQAVRDLAVQSANGTYTSADRSAINTTVQQYLSEVTRIANQTTFNGQNVLNGSTSDISFQVGANVGQTITVDLGSGVRADQLGTDISSTSTVNLSGAFANSGTVDLSKIKIDDVSIGSGTASSAQDVVDAINSTDFSSVKTLNGGSITASLNSSGGIDIMQSGGGSLSISDSGSIRPELTSDGSITADSTYDLNSLTIKVGSGTAVPVASASTLVSSASDVAAAINANSSLNTSVTASVDSKGKLVLTSNSDLTITDDNKSAAATTGANPTAATSGPLFSSTDSTASTTSLFGKAGNSTTADTETGTTSGNLSNGDVLNVSDANRLIAQIDSALSTVSTFSSNLGAIQNRFQSTISTLTSQSDNLTSAQSTIQDANFASETADLSKANVLQQAGISVLATANSQPQQILKLLQ